MLVSRLEISHIRIKLLLKLLNRCKSIIFACDVQVSNLNCMFRHRFGDRNSKTEHPKICKWFKIPYLSVYENVLPVLSRGMNLVDLVFFSISSGTSSFTDLLQ